MKHSGFFDGSHSCQGIVTKFTLKAHPQGEVWVPFLLIIVSHALSSIKGAFATISGQYFDQISAAITKFQVADTKASILPTYNSFSETVRAPRPAIK